MAIFWGVGWDLNQHKCAVDGPNQLKKSQSVYPLSKAEIRGTRELKCVSQTIFCQLMKDCLFVLTELNLSKWKQHSRVNTLKMLIIYVSFDVSVKEFFLATKKKMKEK